MSRQWEQRRRWSRWNTRPALHSLSSRPRRERYTSDDLDAVIDTSMTVGEMEGRRKGRAEAAKWVERILDGDPLALIEAAKVSDEEIADGIDDLEEMLREQAEGPREADCELPPPLDPPPCPPWCVVDHEATEDVVEGMRECAGEAAVIRSTTKGDYSPRIVRLYDLADDRVIGPEVRVGDDTFTAEAARMLAAGILNAADQVDEESKLQ